MIFAENRWVMDFKLAAKTKEEREIRRAERRKAKAAPEEPKAPLPPCPEKPSYLSPDWLRCEKI